MTTCPALAAGSGDTGALSVTFGVSVSHRPSPASAHARGRLGAVRPCCPRDGGHGLRKGQTRPRPCRRERQGRRGAGRHVRSDASAIPRAPAPAPQAAEHGRDHPAPCGQRRELAPHAADGDRPARHSQARRSAQRDKRASHGQLHDRVAVGFFRLLRARRTLRRQSRPRSSTSFRKRRGRVLSLDELAKVWRATEGDDSYSTIVKLLLLLLLRLPAPSRSAPSRGRRSISMRR